MGNPHATFFVANLDAVPIHESGPKLERDPLFPQRANIGFAQVIDPGTIRLKKGGGAGGHNGMRDMIAQLGDGFWRMRIGIGHPGHRDAVLHYVLGRPSAADLQLIHAAKIALRNQLKEPDTLNRFGDERRNLPGSSKIDQFLDVVGVSLTGIRIVPSPQPAIRIGRHGVMNAKAVRDIEFPGVVRRDGHAG